MLPEKVIVAGVEYKVIEVDNVIIDGNANYAGSCSYTDTKIEILNSLSGTKKEQTLVHEILHACFNEAGFNEQDEEVINRVSNVLYQVMKDNNFSFCLNKNNSNRESFYSYISSEEVESLRKMIQKQKSRE